MEEELEPQEPPEPEKPKGKWNGPPGSGRQGSTKGRPVPPDMLKHFRAAFKKKKPGVVDEPEEVAVLRKYLAEDKKGFIQQMTQLEKSHLSTRANYLMDRPGTVSANTNAPDAQSIVTIEAIEDMIRELTS